MEQSDAVKSLIAMKEQTEKSMKVLSKQYLSVAKECRDRIRKAFKINGLQENQDFVFMESFENIADVKDKKENNMGYLIKDDVVKAIREDKETSLMCYSDKRTRDVIEFCYESIEREIERLTQYRLENVAEKE